MIKLDEIKVGIEYDELKKLFGDSQIPYSILLRAKEWMDFRQQVLDRDVFKCTLCENSASEGSDGYGNYLAFEVTRANMDWEVFEDEKPISQNRYYQLHAHHKYYIRNKIPWEYSLAALITVCQYCHKDIHSKDSIPIFERDNKIYSYSNICDRCGGSGYLQIYSHVQGGVCFKCGGSGDLFF